MNKVFGLADEIVRLWNDYDNGLPKPGDFEQLMWETGGLIRTVTDEGPAADPNESLRELTKVLGKRGVRLLDFSFLAETVLLHRAYPNGPPPLSWHCFKFLVEIDDDAVRALYGQEAWYRGWSDVQLQRHIESGLFSGFRIPQTVWRLDASGNVLSVAQTPRGVAIASSQGRASGQENADEFAATYNIRIEEVDWREGTTTSLGTAQAIGNEAILTWVSTKLWLSSVTGLLCQDDGAWRLMVPVAEWQAAMTAIQAGDVIVTVWNRLEEYEFRLCVLEGEDKRWSETFEGWVIDGIVADTAIIVRAVGPVDTESLVRIELQDLSERAHVSVGDRNIFHAPCNLLTQGSQILSPDMLVMRVGEEDTYDIPQSEPSTDKEWRLERISFPGESSRHAISCFDPVTLERVRQWTVEEKPQSLLALPEGRGLVVTCQHTIEAIVPSRSRPIVLARWRGSVVDQPIRIGSRLLWLVHRPDDPRARVKTSDDLNNEEETAYVMEIYNYVTGAWSFLPLNYSKTFDSMRLCGEIVVLIGKRELLAFDAARLLESALTDPATTVEPLEPFSETASIISGLPLSGPADQTWVATVSPELAGELLTDADLNSWTTAKDANESFRIWQHRVAEDTKHVMSWPDFISSAASNCPSEFFALTSTIKVEDKSSPMFGSLDLDWLAIEAVLAWKQSMETGDLVGDTDNEAIRRARILLYEYAMRCASGRSFDVIRSAWGAEGGALIDALPEGVRESVSWLNLARVLPEVTDRYIGGLKKLGDRSKHAGIGAIASIATLAAEFLAPCAAAISNTGGQRVGLWTLQNIWRNWPDGCPPMVENADAFVRFVQDCQREKLLDIAGRTELQMAVARAWEQPVVNKGQMVFVSYSHKQSELAHQVVSVLCDFGVGAILDRNELEDSASDTAVEMWIAESLMRSVTSVYLVSDDVRTSGWVHRESEWQLRVLGTKPSLILPYIVVFGDSAKSVCYPRCRTIDGTALIKRPTETLKHLAGRVVLDWLLALKARKFNQKFGIAYNGAPRVIEITAAPKMDTLTRP